MPQPDHTPWYQPQGAQIIARGGENFANSIGRGLQQGLSDLGALLDRHKEEAKKEVALGKAATATVKASPELLKATGMTIEEFQRLKPADQTANVRGVIEAMGYQRGVEESKMRLQQGVQEFLARKQEMDANTALASAVKAAGTKSFPASKIPMMGVPGQPVTMMDMPATDVKQPVTSQTLLDALAANPEAATTRTGAGVLERALMEQGDARATVSATPRVVELGGRKVLVSDRTGKYDLLDQGTASGTALPDKLAAIDRTALQRRKTDITKAMGNFLTPDVKEFYTKELAGIDAQLGADVQSPKPKAQSAGTPKAVTSQAEYDALKSGTSYIDPQGNIRTKK